MRRAFVGFSIALMLLSGLAGARAQSPGTSPAGLIVIDSTRSVAETEQKLVKALEAAGLKVAARVDHEANAKSVNLQLPPTILLLFGNPKAGTVLMQQQQTIGMDLPLKVLIWEADGKVKLAYNDPAYLARRHDITETAPVLTQVSEALRRFAAAATR